MQSNAASLCVLVITGASLSLSTAADWSQYRGSGTDGQSLEKLTLANFVSNSLPRAWQMTAETGFSSFVIAGDQAFTIVGRQIDGVKREVLVAVNAGDGKEIWAQPFGIARYDGGGESGTANNKGGDGPRSTPAVSDGRVFVYSGAMRLVCFNAKDGKELWSKDIAKDFGGKNIRWQNASSPLLDEGRVFVAGGGAGQAFLAFDQKTGENLWKSQDDEMVHASPIVATIHGVRQVIFFNAGGLVALAPKSGEVLWRHPFQGRNIGASAVVSGDMVYCSAGYNAGAMTVRIKKDGDKLVPEQLWKKPNALMNQWSTPVAKDGFVYGLYGHAAYGSAPLKCVDMATGEEKWSAPNFGMGGVILVDGTLLALCDNGELAIVKATPEAYKEEGRFKAIAGKCWSTPAFSNGKIYLRSTTEGVCYVAAK